MAMIKIFNANDKVYNTNGNIAIQPLKCIETKNEGYDGWYVDLEISSDYKEYIAHDNIVVVPTKSKGEQPFRIKNPEINNRRIKFTAHHIVFDSENYLLADIYPQDLNGMALLDWINSRTDKTSPFTVYSDVSNLGTARIIRKTLKDAFLIAKERIGGHFDFDGWTINLLSSIGLDRGETIRYGKNLQGIRVYENWGNVCTKLLAVGPDGIILPEIYLESDVQYDKPYTKAISFDIPQEEGEELTNEEIISRLRPLAIKYLETHKYPEISYEVEANINQNLDIGDIVYCITKHVTVPTQVQGYIYDVNKKRVTQLVYGNYKRNVKAVFSTIKADIEKAVELGVTLNKVVADQSNLINQLGKLGHVYIDDNEIMILDTLPKEDAQNVLLINLGGIGFSSTGIEGPFASAWTLDGAFNASFITTGVLNASLLKAGMIQSPDGLSYWNLDSGEIELDVKSLKINSSDIQDQLNSKANTGDVEILVGNLGSEVEQLESTIGQQAGEIALRVARDELMMRNIWGINLISNKAENWEQGGLDLETGEPDPIIQDYVVRIKEFIPVTPSTLYSLQGELIDKLIDGFYLWVIEYDENNEIVIPTNIFEQPSLFLTHDLPTDFRCNQRTKKVKFMILSEDSEMTGNPMPISPIDIESFKLKLEDPLQGLTVWTAHLQDIYSEANLNEILLEIPENPQLGNVYLDIEIAELYCYGDTEWVLIGWGTQSSVVDNLYHAENSLTMLEDRLSIEISSLSEGQELLKTYLDVTIDGLSIGKLNEPFSVLLGNSALQFLDDGTTSQEEFTPHENAVAWITGQKMYIDKLQTITSTIVGNHEIKKYNDEITLINYIG